MNARGALALALAAALSLAAAACRSPEGPGEEARGPAAATLAATDDDEARLVFPEEGGGLGVEARSLALPADPPARVRAVIAALLEGPQQPNLRAPLPDGVTLDDVFVDPQGIAYLDFHSQDHPQPPGSGSRLELLRVYSLADTVLLNVDGVRGVVLLWNGVQRPTFAGHVDLTRPLTRDPRVPRPTP